MIAIIITAAKVLLRVIVVIVKWLILDFLSFDTAKVWTFYGVDEPKTLNGNRFFPKREGELLPEALRATQIPFKIRARREESHLSSPNDARCRFYFVYSQRKTA